MQTEIMMKRYLPGLPEMLFSGQMAEGMEKAANCTRCGECEPKCPYELPIGDMVEEFANRYQEARRKYQEQTTPR